MGSRGSLPARAHLQRMYLSTRRIGPCPTRTTGWGSSIRPTLDLSGTTRPPSTRTDHRQEPGDAAPHRDLELGLAQPPAGQALQLHAHILSPRGALRVRPTEVDTALMVQPVRRGRHAVPVTAKRSEYAVPDVAQVKTYRNVLDEYRRHAETKSWHPMETSAAARRQGSCDVDQ